MLKKLIGAALGYRVSRKSRNLNGPAGAALGAVAASVIGRMTMAGLAGALAGGYATRRLMDRRHRHRG